MDTTVTEITKQADEQVKQIIGKAEGQVAAMTEATKRTVEADKDSIRQSALEEAKTNTKTEFAKAKAAQQNAAKAQAEAISDSKVTRDKINAAEAALSKFDAATRSNPQAYSKR